jgi:hypothetical protein
VVPVAAGQPATPQLFDLIADPYERLDVAEKDPDVVAALRERLAGIARDVK